MFDVLTGRTQLQLVEQQQPGSTSSDSTASAAARAIWDAAASTLQEDWVGRARTALLATSGAAVGGGGGPAAPLPTAAESALTSPVSYQEAAATWQQLVLLSGVCNAPPLDEVLLQGGGSSSSGSSGSGSRAAAAAQDDALRERLQHLQAGLRNATGLGIEPGHPTPAHDDVTALAALAVALASPEQTLREHFDSVRMCAYVCVCVHMCAYVCVCVHMCAYVCVYVHARMAKTPHCGHTTGTCCATHAWRLRRWLARSMVTSSSYQPVLALLAALHGSRCGT